MKYSVTVLVDADNAAEALLYAGDILMDEIDAAPLAALGDDVVQVREVPA